MFGTIDSPSKIDPSSPGGASFEAVDGQVQLKDVTFAYPARPGRLVFKQFSLDVPAGSSCALVGESGHGKSTIFALLERFYDPLDGQVLLDGVDVRSLNVHWLRSQLALVSQEPVLFAGTIADNICMGSLGRTDPEALIAAARLANAFDFVSRLPEGFDTRVGGGGIQLSGGQKQRIAIARAVFRNPKVRHMASALQFTTWACWGVVPTRPLQWSGVMLPWLSALCSPLPSPNTAARPQTQDRNTSCSLWHTVIAFQLL